MNKKASNVQSIGQLIAYNNSKKAQDIVKKLCNSETIVI